MNLVLIFCLIKMSKMQSISNQYLTHYWPLSSDNMLDQIGTADMNMVPISFTLDRFGNPNSSLALNGDWTYVPPGFYFDSLEFSISVWVYPQQVGSWSRIIDFGNGPAADNILLGLSEGSSLQPVFQIFSGSNSLFLAKSSVTLALNQWQILVATFNGNNARIYINGTLTSDTFRSYNLTKIQRTNCFIGKSNWIADQYSWSYIDDLRFYNKSLTQTEIIDLINQKLAGNNFKPYLRKLQFRFEVF